MEASSNNVLVGYSGQISKDGGFFFNPYRPGMSDEERLQVDELIRESSTTPTELQRRIMHLVRNGK